MTRFTVYMMSEDASPESSYYYVIDIQRAVNRVTLSRDETHEESIKRFVS